jgi:hypothetical protein
MMAADLASCRWEYLPIASVARTDTQEFATVVIKILKGNPVPPLSSALVSRLQSLSCLYF